MKNPDLVLGYNLGRSPVSCTPALWDPPDNFLLLEYLGCFDGKPHKDDQAASLSQVFRLRQVPRFVAGDAWVASPPQYLSVRLAQPPWPSRVFPSQSRLQ